MSLLFDTKPVEI